MLRRTKLNYKIIFVNLNTGKCTELAIGPLTLAEMENAEHLQILQVWDNP